MTNSFDGQNQVYHHIVSNISHYAIEKCFGQSFFFQCHWLFIWWEYFGSWHSFTRLSPKYPIIESIWYIRDERFLKYMYLEYLIQKIVSLTTMAIHCNPLRLCNMSGNHGPNICPLYTHDCNKFFMLYQCLILLILDVLCSIFAVFHLTIFIDDF